MKYFFISYPSLSDYAIPKFFKIVKKLLLKKSTSPCKPKNELLNMKGTPIIQNNYGCRFHSTICGYVSTLFPADINKTAN